MTLIHLAEVPYRSIQGEGEVIGRPSVFIRCSGCNLRCSWCDSSFAWGEGTMTDIFTVVEVVRELLRPGDLITITGGEPLLQMEALKNLIKILQITNNDIIIETNGTIDPKPLFEFGRTVKVGDEVRENFHPIVFSISPKLSNSGNPTKLHPNFAHFDFYLKFVICNPELDLVELEKWIQDCPIPVDNSKIILQPNGMEHDYVGKLRDLMDYVKEHKLPYRVLPQLHRLVWGWRRRV